MQEVRGGAARTDDELLAGLQHGDEDALGVLYHRYVAAIYRFVLAQVRVVADAEDLTAETFARMIDGLGRFRGEASFKNWLYQIARNAVRNHRRSAGYRLNVPLAGAALAVEASEPPAVEPDVDAERAAAERAATVEAVLRPLPPRYRRILELRFLDGLTVRESARRMGITEANAKVLQYRALRKAAALRTTGEVTSEHGPR